MSLEHVDVLIVGAGLSGIGAGYHLQANCPEKTYAILEARDCIGGTWDLFRYPGIRSDSDMYTLGYSFRPWEDAKSIADGAVDPQLRPRDGERARHRPEDPLPPPRASAPSGRRGRRAGRWRSSATDTRRDRAHHLRLPFMCSGYYGYDEGYTPEFAGTERSRGASCTPSSGPRTSTTPASASS